MAANLFVDFLRKQFPVILTFFIIACLVFLFFIFFGWMGSSKKELKGVINQQNQVITQVVEQNQENLKKAQLDRSVQEQSKEDLLLHLHEQNKRSEVYRDIHQELLDNIAKINTEEPRVVDERVVSRSPEDQVQKKEPVKTIKAAAHKPKKKTLAKAVVKKPQPHQREHRVVYAVQDALWKAYQT